MITYYAKIEQYDWTDYKVSFPDIPGLVVTDRNLRPAKTKAELVLNHFIKTLDEQGKELPWASEFEAMIDSLQDDDGVFVNFIPIQVDLA